MPAYASTIRRPPRTLTDADQARVLKVTGEHRDGFRDHVVLSLALGTALREHEIAGLDVGDILNESGRVRRLVQLRVFKRSSAEPARQEVVIPDACWYKMTKFIEWKRARGESLEPDAPLFLSRRRLRIATRTLRAMFKRWQVRAGLDRLHTFHGLRHSAISNAYRRESRDIRLAQRMARHKNIATTMIYTEPSDQDVEDAFRRQPC